MLAIRNFGKKSLDELVERLEEKGYMDVAGVDLSAFRNGTNASAVEDDENEDEDLLVEETGG